ncbi:MAG: peptidoglycan DD-metalloendopeptidase family protein [Leptolyngbya sp.]|nr:peptidoglycan DD-metalloendopeptidase family protein [Leptolyngbya sp.]
MKPRTTPSRRPRPHRRFPALAPRWWGLGLACVLLWLGLGGLSRSVAAVFPTRVGTEPVLVAQSVQELEQRRRALEQQRQQLQQQQDELEGRQNTSENNLNNLERSILYTDTQIAETEDRLDKAEQDLQRLEANLRQAETDYENVRSGTVARLQFLQRQQASEGWAVLLQSQDFNEFLDRQYQLKRVYAADRQVLQDLKVKADAIQQQKAAVEDQKNQVALLRQQLLSQKQQYEAEANEEKQLIDRLKEQRSALEAAEAQLVRDSDQIANLIRQKLAAQSGAVRGTGRFVFPANARISSGFGNRVHPILGYSRFHSGIDFAAPQGAAIYAADSGQVIFSGWYGGYGQTVIVDHGGGITTLYAHSSRLLVREGQSVQQGQSIAAVGSTGLSTGPHLHFEVRRNGSPVNPMGYL